LGLAGLCEGGQSRVDYLECLIEEIGDGLVRVCEGSIEKVLLVRLNPDSLMRSSLGERLTSWKFCPHHSAACFPACPLTHQFILLFDGDRSTYSKTAKYPCPLIPQ